MIELDEHQKYLIRKTVHSFFSENRVPTIDAVYSRSTFFTRIKIQVTTYIVFN
jgi:hypothetical protein